MKKQTKAEQKRETTRTSSVNQRALNLFYQRPEWMAKFDNNDRKLAMEFIKEALEADRVFTDCLFRDSINMLKGDTYNGKIIRNWGDREKRRSAVLVLLSLLNNLMYESISLEEFLQGKRPEDNNRPHIPDMSHISRFN